MLLHHPRHLYGVVGNERIVTCTLQYRGDQRARRWIVIRNKNEHSLLLSRQYGRALFCAASRDRAPYRTT
jgi:hypothetical protein